MQWQKTVLAQYDRTRLGMISTRVRRIPAILRIAGLLWLTCFIQPWPASGQGLTDIGNKPVVGKGVYYSFETTSYSGAPSSASAEVRGYTDVLPGQVRTDGPVFALSYGSWGIAFGYDDAKFDIGRKADVQGTPTNPNDDVFVSSARRTNTSVTTLWNPVGWLYFGLGKDIGTLAFDQVDANGVRSIRKISYDNNFYGLGLACCVKPKIGRSAPVISLYAKMPLDTGTFASQSTSLSLGWYW